MTVICLSVNKWNNQRPKVKITIQTVINHFNASKQDGKIATKCIMY